MRAVVYSLATTIVATALAGCTTPAPVELLPLSQFTATYEGPDGRIDVSLGDAIELDLGSTTMLAYPLTVRPQSDPGKEYTYYLDGELRVAAVRETCTANEGSCQDFVTMRYDIAGGLPPMGLLWPLLLEENLELRLNHATYKPDFQVQHGQGQVRIMFSGDDWLPSPAMGEQYLRGTYTYQSGSLLPEIAQDLRLVESEQFGPLSDADLRPARAFKAPDNGQPFGGMETELVPGVSASHLWAPVEDELGSSWNGHPCILGFEIVLAQGGDADQRLMGGRVTAKFAIGHDDEHGTVFEVTSSRNALNQRSARISDEASFSTETKCSARLSGPPPGASLEDVMQRIASASTYGKPIKLELRLDESFFGAEPQDGTYSFRTYFAPSIYGNGTTISGESYYIREEAATGRLMALRLHEDALLGPP